jgi:hypothetical protein
MEDIQQEKRKDIKLVWIYKSEDNFDVWYDKVCPPATTRVFGNRADALVFAYHQCFQYLLDSEAHEEFPIANYQDKDKPFTRLELPKDQWPTTPTECALHLRKVTREQYRYAIDDHMDNCDRWGPNSTRVNDLTSKYGSIDISIHDETGHMRWANSFYIEIPQHLVVDDSVCDSIDKLSEYKSLLNGPQAHHGGFVMPQDLTGLSSNWFEQQEANARISNQQAHEYFSSLNVLDLPKGTKMMYHKGYDIYYILDTTMPELSNNDDPNEPIEVD